MTITATYVDADTFTVVTDVTGQFHAGRRINADCGVDGNKYGTILNSSYGAPNTTVNLTSGSDNLTSNLTDVLTGIVGIGSDQSMPVHSHLSDEGDGGILDSSVLDDYEEGSWTPGLADAASGGNAASVGSASGQYTKVGRLVHITGVVNNIDTTGMTSGNLLYLTGLPFTAGGLQCIGTVSLELFTISGEYVTIAAETNSTVGTFSVITTGSTSAYLRVSDVNGSTSDMRFTMMYYV